MLRLVAVQLDKETERQKALEREALNMAFELNTSMGASSGWAYVDHAW